MIYSQQITDTSEVQKHLSSSLTYITLTWLQIV